MEQQEIYTAQEAADRLGMSLQTFKQNLIYTKKISFFRTNGRTGHIRVTRQAIDAFIEQNSSQAGVAEGK